MSLFKKNDDLLDDAVAQVANEPIDPKQVDEAAARVWARLSHGAAAEAPAAAVAEAPVAGSLHGCEDFQTLIPAYLRGELSPARALLVEDHTRSCVPCRRALREAREGKVAAERHPVRKERNRTAWLAAAAVLAVALGFGVFTLIQEMLAGGANMASVQAVEGTLYRVSGDSSQPIGAGESIDEGDEIRTAKGSTALVRMADGSIIEMAERASFVFDAGRKGNTIELERGNVIVHAAKQRDRHLFVATRDALVSVAGTIFAVNTGIKGSRVSVVEGEVRVEQAKRDAILHPGDQVTTHASVERIPVKSEIAWSRNAKQYEELLAELTALGKEIDARVARPGLRYSTRLLDLAPAGTTIWIGLPNLSQSLSRDADDPRREDRREPVAGQVVGRHAAELGQRAEVPRDDREDRRPGPQPRRGDRGGDQRRRRARGGRPGAAGRGGQRGGLPRHAGSRAGQDQHPRGQAVPGDRRRPRHGSGRRRRHAAVDRQRPVRGLSQHRPDPYDRGRRQRFRLLAVPRQDRPAVPRRRRLAVRGRPPLADREGAGRGERGGPSDRRASGHPGPRALHRRPPGDRRPGRDPRRPDLQPAAARRSLVDRRSGAHGELAFFSP